MSQIGRYLCFFILLYSGDLIAQNYPVKIIPVDSPNYTFQDTILPFKKNASAKDQIASLLENLVNKNYLAASLDSFQLDTVAGYYNAYIHIGNTYNFDQIVFDSLSSTYLQKLKIRKPRNTQEFIFMRDKIAGHYSENGYPFSKVRIDELDITSDTILGQINIQSGPQIIIDSIEINGDVKIREGYIENYLDIFKGQVYDHSKVKMIKSRMDKLTFLTQEKDPDLSFFGNYSTVNLYLKKKNSSRFDLIFGVIPTNNLANQQLFLSMDFTAEMLNRLGYGEYLFIDFERLRPEQQKFEVQFNYPYILDFPFAIDADFSIFRLGLNYQTLISDLGVQYLINSTDYIKVGWNFESSTLVEIDTTAILASRELPAELDVDQKGASLELHVDRLDYKFNPREGFSIDLRAVGGTREIKRNSGILALSNSEVDFAEKYDSLELKAPRFELGGAISYFKPIAVRGAIGIHLKGGWRYTSQGLFLNEKYQIGGNKLLRGFDEASIFTSYYALSTLEYRLLLSNNSYFSFPFVDFGFIEDTEGHNEFVTGIGGGLGFETKVGLFNFSIAVGQNSSSSFDFAKPKAHFGFVSLF